MDTGSADVVVRHHPTERRFECTVDGLLCVAEYQPQGGEWVMTHTFVPAELRGRGLAEKLVRAALDHARAHGIRIVPACSYVDAFVRRHAEYQRLLG